MGFMTAPPTERAKLLRDRPLSEIAPIRWWCGSRLTKFMVCSMMREYSEAFNSLTSRQLLPVKALI
jgi:hypothetical protein